MYIPEMISLHIKSMSNIQLLWLSTLLLISIQYSVQGRFHIVQVEYNKISSYQDFTSLGLFDVQSISAGNDDTHMKSESKLATNIIPTPLTSSSIYYIKKHKSYEIIGRNYIEGLSLIGYHDNINIRKVSSKVLSSCEMSGYINITYNTSSSYLKQVLSVISAFPSQNDLFTSTQQYPKIVDNLNFPFIRNPSVIKIHDRYLVVSAYPGYPGYNNDMKVYWMNFTVAKPVPYVDIKQSLYIGISSAKRISLYPGYGFRPEDVRMLVINDNHIHLVYTISHTDNVHGVGISDLKLNIATNSFELTSSCQLEYPYNAMKPITPTNQKNWSPFLMYDDVFYIMHINPLTIVKAVNRIANASSCPTLIISEDRSSYANLRWKFGAIRGGSNAVYLGMGKYLAFFHSRIQLPNSSYTTYFMGAYTFSTRHMPFYLSEMTPFPILQRQWYDDFSFYRYNLDYVVFPMSLMWDRGELVLSYGRQDQYGYVARFRLQALLEMMERLNRTSTTQSSYSKLRVQAT